MPPRNRTPAQSLRARQQKFVDGLPIGSFRGQFRLEWIGPSAFNYWPDPQDPFYYVRKNKAGEEIEIITPQPMDTDGGSIPRLAQLLPGLAPWEYGPAYLIHDWEFHAHDLARTPRGFSFRKSFKQVNLTLAEAIWTLMNDGYLNYAKPPRLVANVHTIHAAVSSAIGKAIWDG